LTHGKHNSILAVNLRLPFARLWWNWPVYIYPS